MPPVSGTNPIFIKDWINLADFAAKVTSQQMARFAPAPAAMPLTKQITGFLIDFIFFTNGL